MFAIKAEIQDPNARIYDFPHLKTMNRGNKIAPGDTVFIFAGENEGGDGLVAKGVITAYQCDLLTHVAHRLQSSHARQDDIKTAIALVRSL